MKGIIGIVVAVVIIAVAANFVIDLCSGSVSKAYFDERINAIECKIDTLTAHLGIVERKIDTLTVKVEAIECNSDTIKNQVRENSWKLDVIKSDINEMKGNKGEPFEFRLF
jgi:archaellum component FlaC